MLFVCSICSTVTVNCRGPSDKTVRVDGYERVFVLVCQETRRRPIDGEKLAADALVTDCQAVSAVKVCLRCVLGPSNL